MSVDDYYSDRNACELAEKLALIDWAKYPELASMVRSDIANALGSNPRGRPELFTREMKEIVCQRHARGERVRAIAYFFGVCPGTIYRILAERNGRRPHHW